MKKIYILGLTVLFCLAIVACSKENKVQTSDKITVKAITEDVNTSGSKVSISESGTHFSLNWEGTETFGVANSTNNNEKKSGDSWTINSHSGTNASISGTLPSADGTTANYIFSNNYFSSAGGSGGVVRVVVPSTQDYNGSVLANNCLLIARADGATVGTLPGSLSFKTMNGFLKFSLVKGSAAPGSSNDYTHMYVQSIVVEAIGHEDIAGRFEVSKTAADWATSGSYAGTVAGSMSDKITLNCTSVNSDGEELSAVAKDFYVAVAFGDYASGIKVTINVENQDGDAGVLEKTFGTGAGGVTIGRNKMKALSSLTVNPEDAAATPTYTKVTSTPANWSGTYIIVYEESSTAGKVCQGGLDAASNYYSVTISSNKITSSLLADYEVEVSTYSTGYSIKALGGSNKNKYLQGKTADSNGTDFKTSADAVTEFSLSAGLVTITNNSKVFAYNLSAGNLRWRFFKSGTVGDGSGNYKIPALYKKD